MKNDGDLFFTCSLIEFIGRQQKRKRSDFFYQPRDYIRECYLEGEVLS